MPKLLDNDQKQEGVRVCSDFIAAIHHWSKSILECIVTMEETMVSYHTLETKKESKQWIPKGQQGPINVQAHTSQTMCTYIHTSWTKQTVLALFRLERTHLYAHHP